jgi:hypothetical protein
MGHCHVPHNNQMFRVSHFLISLLELAKAGTVINAKLNSCRGSGAVLRNLLHNSKVCNGGTHSWDHSGFSPIVKNGAVEVPNLE